MRTVSSDFGVMLGGLAFKGVTGFIEVFPFSRLITELLFFGSICAALGTDAFFTRVGFSLSIETWILCFILQESSVWP